MTWRGSNGVSWKGLARWRGIAFGVVLLFALGSLWRAGGEPLASALAQAPGVAEDEGDSAPAPTAKSASKGKSAARPKTMFDMWLAGGVIGMLVCLLSVVAVGFVIEHSISIRKSRFMPPQVLADLEQMIARGEIEQAVEYCQQPHNHSLSTEVILAGLDRYRSSEFGFAEYKSAVEEAGEDHTGRLYRKTEVLGVIGAVAPMLGLLGTVQGMIIAFNQIASSGGMAKPDELASGIGLALVTTFEGLVVAIPSMVAFSFFRNKIDSLVAEAGKHVERVLMPLGRKR